MFSTNHKLALFSISILNLHKLSKPNLHILNVFKAALLHISVITYRSVLN